MGIKSIQIRLLTTDGGQGETVASDVFNFSENGEHVMVFTALTSLIASGPQPQGITEVSHCHTLHSESVGDSPLFESQDVTQVNVRVRAADALATGIAIALILD